MTPEAKAVLARYTDELARIPAQAAALSRRRFLLRDAATQLRLGAHPHVIERIVRVATERERRRTA